MKFRSDKQKRLWERQVDWSTPRLRRMLDRLEGVRPDMAPLKLSSPPDEPRMVCTTPLRRPGHGYFGCYTLTEEWIKKEIRRVRRRDREEQRAEVEQHVGAFI